VDLTGEPAGDGSSDTWTCTEIPIDVVSKYTSKALNILDKYGLEIL